MQVVEREYPLLTAKEVNSAIKQTAAPQAGGARRLHRHRRAHRRHRRDPQHQGLRGREGPRVLPGDQGREPRRPGARARAGRPGPRGEGRRGARVPGRHPARRPPDNTREMSAAFRESYPAGTAPLLVVGGPRFDEQATAELGVDRIFGRGTTPGEVASYLVHALRRPEGLTDRMTDDPPARPVPSRTAATCRTRTPTTPATWSTAPTCSGCSATSPPRCASAPTATRGCSRPTPTCSSGRRCGPATCVEVEATVTRVGTRSRELAFEARVVCRGAVAGGDPTAAPVGRGRARPADRRGDRRRHRRRAGRDERPDPACAGQWPVRVMSGSSIRSDTPNPLTTKGNSLRPTSAPPPAALRIGAGQRAVDRHGSDATKVSDVHHRTPTRNPPPRHYEPASGQGRRNAQAPSGCQVRPPASPRVRERPTGVRHGKGPTAQ